MSYGMCIVCGTKWDNPDTIHWMHEKDCPRYGFDFNSENYDEKVDGCECDVIACELHCPVCDYNEIAGQFEQEYISTIKLARELGEEFSATTLTPWLKFNSMIFHADVTEKVWFVCRVTREESRLRCEHVPPEDLPDWLLKIMDVEVIPNYDPPLLFGYFVDDYLDGVDLKQLV